MHEPSRESQPTWVNLIRPSLVEATRVLSQFTGLTLQLVDMSLQTDLTPLEALLTDHHSPAIQIGVRGQRPVNVLVWFPDTLAETLVEALTRSPVEWPLTGIAQSALLELANVGVTAFINVIADILHVSWPITPPRTLSLNQQFQWIQTLRAQRGAMVLVAVWRVNNLTSPPLIMVWSPPTETFSGDSTPSLLPNEWIRPEQWNEVLNTSTWYPLVVRWAKTWANRYTERHWNQIVVQTLPFSVASLWRVVESEDTAELLAAKSYRLMPGERVSLRDPHQNLIAAAYQWRSPVLYPHRQVFSLMRYLTQATRVLAIPLATDDRVVGILTVGEVQAEDWSKGLAAAVQDFAPLLAQALQQRLRLAELERHAALFRWMNQVVETVWNPAVERRMRPQIVGLPSGILRTWRREWPYLAGIRGGLWIFWDESRQSWRIHDSWGPWIFRTAELHAQWWPKLRQWLQTEDDDCRRRGWRIPPHPAAFGGQRVYWYPISEEDRLIGGGVLWIPEEAGNDSRVLESLLDVVGMALVAIRRQRQLTRQSQQDPLTETLNRRGLEQAVEDLLQSPTASAAVFCVVDLDRFKPVNDTWGHEVGDQLLVEWSQFVRRSLRSGDWIARIGGDEFVWVLVESSWSDAVQQRLRHLVENGPLSAYGASATIGVVDIPREATSYREAYRLADQRLYIGKQQGRSRIIGPAGTTVVLHI